MRWGVRDESTNDHQTGAICMEEIRNCQKLSAGPTFAALLGQKYGYTPIPAVIDAAELDSMCQLLHEDGKDTALLRQWYLEDKNAVPSQYLLQPINSILVHFDTNVVRVRHSLILVRMCAGAAIESSTFSHAFLTRLSHILFKSLY